MSCPLDVVEDHTSITVERPSIQPALLQPRHRRKIRFEKLNVYLQAMQIWRVLQMILSSGGVLRVARRICEAIL